MPEICHSGVTLHYEERGNSECRPVILIHGLFLSSSIMERLAAHLGEYHVVLLDLHGHGRSSRPQDPRAYSMRSFADDVIALLDHLGVERATVGGLSLGANVAYQLALDHPERLEAMILEMPVLTRGVPFGRPMFTALGWFFDAIRLVLDPLHPLLQRIPIPSAAYELLSLQEIVTADHRAQIAMIHGLLAEEPPPSDPQTLAHIEVPALVIGHRGDPLHVLEDAQDLARGLPNARMITALTMLDFRLRPDRLAAEVRRFLEPLPQSQHAVQR